MRRTPLDDEELESLTRKRVEIFLERPSENMEPPYIAIVHDRTAPFHFSAGIAAFGGINSFSDPSAESLRTLWDLGRAAARGMYEDHNGNLAEVELLATVVVANSGRVRYMWTSSPTSNNSFEVIMTDNAVKSLRSVEINKIQGKSFTYYIECGFRFERYSIEMGEIARWN